MSSQLSIIAEINIDFDVSFDKPYHSEDKWNHKLSNISGNYLIPHVSDVKKFIHLKKNQFRVFLKNDSRVLKQYFYSRKSCLKSFYEVVCASGRPVFDC